MYYKRLNAVNQNMLVQKGNNVLREIEPVPFLHSFGVQLCLVEIRHMCQIWQTEGMAYSNLGVVSDGLAALVDWIGVLFRAPYIEVR